MECLREGFEEVLELGGDHHPVKMPLRASRRRTGPVPRSPRPERVNQPAKARVTATKRQ
jgi:hypothetical protein